MAVAQKGTRPVQMLAGKRTERVVMRNEGEAIPPRREHGIADISGRTGGVTVLDESPSGATGFSEEIEPALRQRREALAKADAARMERADTRKRLRHGDLDWDSFLDEPPASCRRVPVAKVLTWLPNIGPDRAKRILLAVPGVDVDVLVEQLSCKAKYALSHQVTLFYGRRRRRHRVAA